jgi:hypothetical protein
MLNAYNAQDMDQIIARIQKLSPESTALWGTMSVSQMFAHCNVTYEMAFEDKHPKPNFLMRLLLKLAVKPMVVNEKPYPKNSRTAPAFIISDAKEFQTEKTRLLDYIQKTLQLGAAAFEGKESLSFGPLTANEWSNLFVKHLDHHLQQFGV